MAISEQNVITYGLKGKVGDLLVFRKQNGKTVVSKMPAKSSVPPTQLQKDVNTRFRLASKFAKQALLDPTLAAKYLQMAKKGQKPFNAAFSDFFSQPELSNATGIYNGQVNTVLGIDAIDNYDLKSVTLQIMDANDTLIEQGEAVLQFNGITFNYTCTVSQANPTGCKWVFTASDWAGNNSVLEQEV